jgi:hypothetical protein
VIEAMLKAGEVILVPEGMGNANWSSRDLSHMRRLSEITDFAIIAGLVLAGLLQWPMILIALGAGLLAASPILKYHAMAREHPDVDVQHVVRDISIQVGLYAIASSIMAYLAGRLLALWWEW